MGSSVQSDMRPKFQRELVLSYSGRRCNARDLSVKWSGQPRAFQGRTRYGTSDT